MLRHVILSSLLAIAQMVGLAGVAVAQGYTIVNTTNACINSTYKLFSPNMISPTFILIDRRVTFNQVTFCTTATSNSALCNRDMGVPMFLGTSAASTTNIPMLMQLTMMPSCSWNCGVCGTIITNGANSGLPVELMDFSINDPEEGKEDPGPDEPASEPTDNGAGSTGN